VLKFRDLAFYDVQGHAVAYSTDTFHVYAFCGLLLGYLDGDSVYSFRGRHLGWWEDGWVFDHHGARALFTEAAVGGPPLPSKQARPGRGFKDPPPTCDLQDPKPARVVFVLRWSPRSGERFFGR
jgi:hypothetical protein